ncbi:MAG: TlpA family protein disulfide reductase [Prevotellaceae bacterium]|jgi:thiol-disulfide isomerase/thioredoxin|nr:TlpA family protein disulfide reductase [Prevotellaceae bacterium]
MLPTEFFGFLKDVPVNNQQILSSKSFSGFINRLEHSSVFSDSYRHQPSTNTLEQYLFEELGLSKTPDDVKHFKDIDSLNKQLQLDSTNDGRQKIFEKINESEQAFALRYKKHIKDYQRKYLELSYLNEWRIKDSIYTNVLKLKLGCVSDMIKTRELVFMFGQSMKDNEEFSKKILAILDKSLHEKFLKQEAKRLFDKYFSPEVQTAYELPDTEETAAFKKIIEPFKGKYILVDFWATWCGPCVSEIKDSKAIRESHKDSKDVAFVFITGAKESPLEQYNKFIEEQGLEHTYIVSELDYFSFRQLFAFNGIPHYVVVDREGRILNNITGMYNFENELKTLLENEKQ